MSRRIGGAGGGSDPGPGKGARAVVATATAVVVAAGGTGAIGGGAAVSSSTSSAAQSALARNLGAKKADARNAARRGDTRGAWQRMGLRQAKNRVENYVDCVTHSVGEVRSFLARTPCRRLDRMLTALTDGDGNVLVVAVAWVEFRGRRDARAYQDLSDTYGTGYVTPVAGSVLELADIRLTGQHYESRVAGATTVTAEAEPVHGHVDDAVLDAIAEVAVWAPRR
jgi:hypothetical protein